MNWIRRFIHSDAHILLIMLENRVKLEMFFCVFKAIVNGLNFFEGLFITWWKVGLVTIVNERLFELRRIFECFFNGLNTIWATDHRFKNDLKGVNQSLMLIPSVAFGLEVLKPYMTLAALESDFLINKEITGKLFEGSHLSFDLEIPKETDKLIGIQTQDKFLEIFFLEFVNFGLRRLSRRSRFNQHLF